MYGLISKALTYGGKGGGAVEPISIELSLDAINSLDDMATITVGEFIWKCKRPVTLGSGFTSAILTEGQKSKSVELRHFMPLVINDKYAMLGVYGDNYPDSYIWREVDGVEKYHKTLYANHRVSGVGYTKRNYYYSFINPQISYSLYGTKYYSDDDRDYSPDEIYMGDVSVGLNGVITITNMTPKEQGEFVKSYLESEPLYDPVITIL